MPTVLAFVRHHADSSHGALRERCVSVKSAAVRSAAGRLSEETIMSRILLAFGAVSMIGCSTVNPPPAPDPDVDHEYVAKVERSARLGNAQVTWVARPTKRTTTTN